MVDQEERATKVYSAVFILALIAVVALGPLFTIWSLNHLFNLQIAASFENCVAVAWLVVVIHGVKLYLASGYADL